MKIERERTLHRRDKHRERRITVEKILKREVTSTLFKSMPFHEGYKHFKKIILFLLLDL